MTDPAAQRAYDAVSAEHEAAGAAVTRELRARLAEMAARVAAHRERPEPPRVRRPEDGDLPASAAYYMEEADD